MRIISCWVNRPDICDKEETAAGIARFNLMCASVRRAMPGVPIWQYTDMESPELDVDYVHRAERTPAFSAWAAVQTAMIGQDSIYLDGDILVVKDLSPLLETECDVMLTHRVGGELVWQGRHMRYNLGVFATHNPLFWFTVSDRVKTLPLQYERDWYGGQIVVHQLACEPEWNVKSVPMREYNYIPDLCDKEFPSYVRCVHFKGLKRKDWMARVWRDLNKREAA